MAFRALVRRFHTPKTRRRHSIVRLRRQNGARPDRRVVRGLQREPSTFRAQNALASRVHQSPKPNRRGVRLSGGNNIPRRRDTYTQCCVWCLAMGFILQKPGLLVNSLYPNCPAQGAHSNRRPIFCSKPFTLQQVTQEQTTQKLQI